MKIISLNTWSGVVIKPLLDFFEKYNEVDVFCLQEVYNDAVGKDDSHPHLDMKLDLFQRIESQLRDTHVGYFRPAYKDFYGLAIFIKRDVFVMEEGDTIIFENNGSEQRGMHGRNLQYVRIKYQEQSLLIANVHGLWNGKGKTDTDERLSQSNKIKEFLAIQKEPVVLMGDFNLNPDTKSLLIIAEGLENLIKKYNIKSTRTSFYIKEGKFADYAFVSAQVEVRDFKVLPEEVSDHAALYLEIG
jgi:endonuclease/exonuclease/phosphatase family metal-dependent hydrolase